MKTVRYRSYVFFDKRTVGTARGLTHLYGVRYNSYAGEVLRRIYYYFFGDAKDIKKEYRKYYKKEFESFEVYAECHLGIPRDIVKRFENNRVFYVDLRDKGECVVDNFYYDDEIKAQFWMLLGGMENENSNRLRNEQFFD